MAEQKIKRELSPEQQEALEKISKAAAELGISEKKMCERIGVSSSVISQIRGGYYPGDWDKQFDRIYSYFENKTAAAEAYSEVEYAPTSISTLVYKTLRNVQLKGGFAFVTGDAGIGKTKAIRKYIADNPLNSVMITVNPCTKSTTAVLKLLAMELGVPVSQSRDDLWMSIAAKLHDGMVVAVDEAQLLTFGSIETLRSFADFFSERGQTLGVALVGNQGIREKIEGRTREQYRQVANRAWQRQQISTTDVQPEDIRMLFPILNGKEQELNLLYKVAQTAEGIRGAVRLFGNAYDAGSYDFKGIVSMAKMMHLDLKGAEKVVRA
ncbi:MAG: AAA family ATPase [Oscillospiraceae bacterium]